jgi:asparagine synthase (glutamine-hydrolysing)
MSRWLAGSFDPSGRTDASGLADALAPHEAETLASGPLRLAYSGPLPGSVDPLCLLDGHLDNAAEIQHELEEGGGPGSVASHEELLAAGYRRWGRGLLGRMRGDFALLLWDRERKEGLLARDQLGARPLFLHSAGGTLRFASEIRNLLALLPTRPGPDPASVAHWVATSNRPGTQTLYRGIRRLRPGGVLVLDRHGAREECYWAPRFEEPLDLPPTQLAIRVREELERAVHRRLGDDGATGVMMSGGLDSSSIAALCPGAADREVYACSATFPDHPAVDESELIGDLTRTLGLPGITAEVRAGGLLAGALEHLTEWKVPVSSWGDPWALALMRAAREEGVKTMLGGDGGDELFGPRAYLLADRLRAGHPFEAFALTDELPGAGAHVPRREVARMFCSLALAGALPYALHNPIQAPLARREAPSWLLRRTVRDLAESSDPLAWKRLDGPRWWAYAAHGVTRGIEEAGVFQHQRRRAVLADMEVRSPMLDLDLVQLSLRQPPLATLDRRFDRPVLRAGMAGLLPDAVRLRPEKARFESWIVDGLAGPDGTAVRRILTEPDAELGAYLDLAGMRRALFESDSLRRGEPFRWMWQVWRLLTAELWLRAQAFPTRELRLDSSPGHAQITIQAGRASYLFPP